MGLKSINIQIDTRNYPVIPNHPFTDISQPRRTKDRVWKHNTHASTRSKELRATLNKKYFRWYRRLQTRSHLPHTRFLVTLPYVRKFKLFKDIPIFNRYLASERRVRDNDIEITNRIVIPKRIFVYAKGFSKTRTKVLRPLMRRKQGICLQDVSAAIIIHDHIHLCGLYQVGINVKAEIIGSGHFRDSILKCPKCIRIPIFPLDTKRS